MTRQFLATKGTAVSPSPLINIERTFKGMPAILMEEGKEVGHITDVVVHPIEGFVMGFVLITNDGKEQVLVANPDQLIFVFATQNPATNLRKLDRFLVVAEVNALTAVICVNKIDLVGLDAARRQFKLYEDIGYQVIYTSAVTGEGVAELRDCLHDKLSVLTGSSGVGKSSLLNAIEPGLGLKVRDVSQTTGKGLHTTRYAELFPLAGGGYLADTPGIRGLALYDLEPWELDAYFREIAPLVEACQFSDCSHRHEPNCAVRTAVEDGRISLERYDSYLRLREEHEMLDKSAYE